MYLPRFTFKSPRSILAASVFALVLLFTLSATPTIAATWSGGSGVWSSNANPGWNGTGVPNAVGAVATVPAGFTMTNDVNPTIGTLEVTGSGSGTFTLQGPGGPDATITLNEDGAGAGFATLSISTTNTNSRFSIGSNNDFILADDLLISNTSNSTQFSAFNPGSGTLFSGTGNVTFFNSSNSITSGTIVMQGDNTFIGDVLIQKGSVTINRTGLGHASNSVTLGSVGQGSATLVSNGSTTNLESDVTVTAGTGGTLLLGSTHGGTTTSTYSGSITLNDSLSITSAKSAGGEVAFTNVISGVGGITKTGTGEAAFSGINTYTGDTAISAGTLTLEDGSEMRFDINNASASNSILGIATVEIDGLFRLDIADLTDASGVWNLVDVATLAETFGSNFGLAFVGGPAFSDDGGGVYSSGDWLFSTATGSLTLTAIPEPASLALIALGGVLMIRRRRSF